MANRAINTETLFAAQPPEVVSFGETPTISIAASLMVSKVVMHDLGGEYVSIHRNAFVPSEDLSISMQGGSLGASIRDAEFWDGLDYARVVGEQVLAKYAVAQGYEDYSALHRAVRDKDPDYPSPDNDPAYYRLVDGGPMFDMDKSSQLVKNIGPLQWQDLLNNYGADDPVVREYFKVFDQSVRVDTPKHFSNLIPTFLMHFVSEKKLNKMMAVQQVFTRFLKENGLNPAPDDFVVLDLDSSQ